MVFVRLCGARRGNSAPKRRYAVEGKVTKIGSMSENYKISIVRHVETA